MRALTGTALGRAALLLTALDVLHALDHTRQGRDLASEVYVAGVAGWIALALLLVLVARGHRLSPPFPAGGGGRGAGGVLPGARAAPLGPVRGPDPPLPPPPPSWGLGGRAGLSAGQ